MENIIEVELGLNRLLPDLTVTEIVLIMIFCILCIDLVLKLFVHKWGMPDV